ncbi:PAS domain S-box-containing protein/diguanylate cyclase (GGDEF)-like protein [Roseibium hamelinense]|uniref:PAS domain S-box-containing protein/diguanylate cyclase (GGDEF)-like protein n=2 Tax=Roseibium hamelinense TaxID=150831 RepID=A0A562TI44_9HYPH|nr:PAS domain S-box-containing protein/diguanylate cyclase (GGDEF)-like protein [Roseibium hamelinense]
MLEYIRRSTQRKFLVLMFATLIAVNGPLLLTFFVVTKNTMQREMIAKKEIVLNANAKAFSKLLWDYDYENLEKWTTALATERDVFSVEVFDDKGKRVAFASNDEGRPRGTETEETLLSKEIIHQVDDTTYSVGAINIRFISDRIRSAAVEQVAYPVILFVVSTFSVLVAALLANRFMITRPLNRLNDAIETTHRSGSRKKVEWSSSDELGRVSDAFNEMQDSLDKDEEKLRKANKRLAFLYHNTPVMLYSIDIEDRIVNVSDYWLDATGYQRDTVLGRKFSDFICQDCVEDYLANRRLLVTGQHETLEFTSVFLKSDGTRLDVLITEIRDFDKSSTGRQSLSVMTDICNLKAAEAKILHQARTDFLTGLLNRQGFTHRLNEAIYASAGTHDVAVLFFDLDKFKWVNDNLGHFAGDQVLLLVTQKVSELLQPSDCFGRFGGDEFAIMLTGEHAKTRAVELAIEINQALRQPINIIGRQVQISASIGISYYPENAASAEDLLKTSDVAMYRQKSSGRNGHCVFDVQFGQEAARQLEIRETISEALEHDWFELYFQPIVNLKSRSTVGFEGLLRLIHPEQGVLPPLEYIQVAEQTGSILEIGDKVLELGMQALQKLEADPDWRDSYVALNLSAAQFLPELPDILASNLSAYSVSGKRLVLEITETTLMQSNLDLDKLIARIKGLGCALALDDFGTGFSSLSYMNRFDVDVVKIDQSFTRGLGTTSLGAPSNKTAPFIEAIVGLSQKLALTVIAEGIETEDQLQCLIDRDVTYGQGYLFGKPKPLDHYLRGSQEDRSAVISFPALPEPKVQQS